MLIFMVKSGFSPNQCIITKGGMLSRGREGGQWSTVREEKRGDKGQRGRVNRNSTRLKELTRRSSTVLSIYMICNFFLDYDLSFKVTLVSTFWNCLGTLWKVSD